jgi:hypothetical protein
MEALGRVFDIGTGWAPVDIDTANGATGKRISMNGASGITFVFFGAVGGAEDLTLDLQQHTASTGGTTADLDAAGVAGSRGPTYYHIKAEATLDNDESWVKVTQSEASECVVVGATYGALQKIVAIHVPANALADGYTHVSVVASITTATPQLMGCLYLLHDLYQQRKPTSLPNLLNPGAANV